MENYGILKIFGLIIPILKLIFQYYKKKSFIFVKKIQIRDFANFSENWIFGHNLRFSDNVTQENQISEAVLE